MRSDSQLYSTKEENDFCHFIEVTQPEGRASFKARLARPQGPHFHSLYHRCQQDPVVPATSPEGLTLCVPNPEQGWSISGAQKNVPKAESPTRLGGQGSDPSICLFLAFSTEPTGAR